MSSTTVEVRQNLATGDEKIKSVELKNRGNAIAFAIELKLVDARIGCGVVPIFWEDNYLSLLPGESRTIEVEFNRNFPAVLLEVQGWNVDVQ